MLKRPLPLVFFVSRDLVCLIKVLPARQRQGRRRVPRLVGPEHPHRCCKHHAKHPHRCWGMMQRPEMGLCEQVATLELAPSTSFPEALAFAQRLQRGWVAISITPPIQALSRCTATAAAAAAAASAACAALINVLCCPFPLAGRRQTGSWQHAAPCCGLCRPLFHPQPPSSLQRWAPAGSHHRRRRRARPQEAQRQRQWSSCRLRPRT